MSLYVDGEHIVSVDGLKMRTSPEQVVDSMVFHTFFGGSGKKWAATRDEVLLSYVLSLNVFAIYCCLAPRSLF